MSQVKRNIQFGTIMNMLYLVAIFMTIGAIGRLVWWSYNETLKLSAGVTGGDYGMNLATLVQLGPLVFLLARRTFKQHKIMHQAAVILLWLAIAFNLADMATNFLAYALGGYVLPAELLVSFSISEIPQEAAWVIEALKWWGGFVCAVVTWGEEGIVWLLAISGHYIYLVLLDLGYRAPEWMSVTRSHGAKPEQSQQRQSAQRQPQRDTHQPATNGNGRVGELASSRYQPQQNGRQNNQQHDPYANRTDIRRVR